MKRLFLWIVSSTFLVSLVVAYHAQVRATDSLATYHSSENGAGRVTNQGSPNLAPAGDLPIREGAVDPFSLESTPYIDPTRAPVPAGGEIWVAQGQGPATGGQAENCTPNNQVVGGAIALAAHPTNADTLWAAAVNGGIWKTTNFTALNPAWTPQTDQFPSLSMGCLDLDPTDGSHQTLVAGIGIYSNLARAGGARTGLLKTTDGGNNWFELNGGGFLVGKNVVSVASRGAIIVVAVDFPPAFAFDGGGNLVYVAPTVAQLNDIGIFRSINGGATFAQVSGAGLTGLPFGRAFDLVGHRNTPGVLYTAIRDAGAQNGVYKSTDSGATWARVSNLAMNALIVDPAPGDTQNIRLAVHDNPGAGTNSVYAAILRNDTNGPPNLSTRVRLRSISTGMAIGGIFRSTNGGGAWTAMSIPTTTEAGGVNDPNPGGQGIVNFVIAADPINSNIVYVGGDRQPDRTEPNGAAGNWWPNSLGAVDYTGRLFRGDASQPLATQWTPLTHNSTANNSAPHADSRRMVFDVNANLIEADDAGVFFRTSPRDNTGRWFSGVGNSQMTEFHSIAYDAISNIIVGGAQDAGATEQVTSGGLTWRTVALGDGGDVAVDNIALAGMNRSIRYVCSQNLGLFSRRTYDNNNVFIPLPVTNATNATPIKITSANHGLINGDLVRISDVLGNTAANTNRASPTTILFQVTNVAANTFDLLDLNGNNVAGNAAYGGGGQIEVFPGLAGAPTVTGQFVTPMVANAVAGNRIVFGGSNGVFESTDAGSTVTRLIANPVNDRLGHRALAYGGTGNPDALYAGSGNQVFVRSVAAGALAASAYPGGVVNGIALVLDTPSEAYVVDANARVFRAVNFGALAANWTDITGNLTNSGALHCVAHIATNNVSVGVVVGSDIGVFVCLNPGAITPQWNELGTNLPNALVYSLQYNRARDVLVAGTMGRGAWRINNAGTQRCCLPTGFCVMTDLQGCADIGGTLGPPFSVCGANERCCLPDGSCIATDPLCCLNVGGLPGGAGTACAPIERCCLPNGTCVNREPVCCLSVGGIPGGVGTACAAPQRCCLPNGQCLNMDPACCAAAGGTTGPVGSVCAAPRRCCLPNGSCIDTPAVCCLAMGGIAGPPGSVCQPPVACCLLDGSCINTDATCCNAVGGIAGGIGSACALPESCCLPSGLCINTDPFCCLVRNGIPGGFGSSCAPSQSCCLPGFLTCIDTDPICCGNVGGIVGGPGSSCGVPQRCCLGSGICINVNLGCCLQFGGVPGAVGTACAPPQACCFPSGVCINTDPICCAATGGIALAPGTICLGDANFNGIDDACEPPGCTCRGDINLDGSLNGRDVRAFLDCLFTGSTPGGNCACADMDHSGSTGTSDVPGFVNALLLKGCGP